MEGTRSGLPLLAASARPRAGVLLAGCAVLVAVLGAVFARQNMADRFDHAVDAPVITWFAGHHGLALWLAFPGTTKPAVALSVVIAAACLLTGRLRRRPAGRRGRPGRRRAVRAAHQAPGPPHLYRSGCLPERARRSDLRAGSDSYGAASRGTAAGAGARATGVRPDPGVPDRRGRRRRRDRRALPLLHRHGGGRRGRDRHGMRAGPGDQPVPAARVVQPARTPLTESFS